MGVSSWSFEITKKLHPILGHLYCGVIHAISRKKLTSPLKNCHGLIDYYSYLSVIRSYSWWDFFNWWTGSWLIQYVGSCFLSLDQYDSLFFH